MAAPRWILGTAKRDEIGPSDQLKARAYASKSYVEWA